MRIFRKRATAAAVALGLTAALVAAPAIAADYYYVDSDLGTEDAASDRGYPDNIWFTGQSTTGTQTTTEDGLEVTARTMLLHGAAEIPLTGERFIEIVQSISVDADGPWSLQLPIYYDSLTPYHFTTFRPAANNTAPGALDSEWISTGGPLSTPTLQEIADDIDAAIDAEYSPVLLAFGLLVDTGETTVRSFTIDGDTHFFTPEPEEEPAPVEDEDEDQDENADDDVAAPATPVDAEATFTG